MDKIKNELVIATEAVRTLMVATIALGLSFKWLAWDKEQIGAVLGEFGALSGLLTAIARSGVTPNRKVALTTRDVGAIEAGQAQAQS